MISGDKIKAARLRLGETQRAFATRFNVDQATIARWEKWGISDRGPNPLTIMQNLLNSLRGAAQ